jgi:hypothetical protein
VVLGDTRPGDSVLPPELEDSLREWGAVASTVALRAGPVEQDLVRRRGRQLAGRVSDVLGRPVEYVDPVTGGIDVVRGPNTGPLAGLPLVAEHRARAESAEPTPWATGLTVALFFAVLAAVGDIALSRAFGAAFGALWVPANVMVVLGLAPSMWIARRVPFWRWIALGTAVGLGVAWVCLVLTALL